MPSAKPVSFLHDGSGWERVKRLERMVLELALERDEARESSRYWEQEYSETKNELVMLKDEHKLWPEDNDG